MTSKRLTTYAEDVQYDAQWLDEHFDNECQWLVALTEWQLSVIVSSLRYAHWQSRWINCDFQEVFYKVQELEHCLMSGCQVSDLIEAVNGIGNKLIYNDKSIAQIVYESGTSGVTLQEYIDNFEEDDIVQHPFVYAVLTMLGDILPSNMAEQYLLSDPAEFTLAITRHAAELIMDILGVAIDGLQAGAETGGAVAVAAGAAVSALDTIFRGVTAGALSLQAIIDLIGLFSSGEDPDNDPDLRALLRVYNSIFVEQQAMSITQNNQQIVTCGGSCGMGSGGVCFVADESGAGSSIDDTNYTLPDPGEEPPADFETWGGEDGYYNYKCKAANALTLGFAERLYQLGDFGNGDYTGSTHAVTARFIETTLRGLDVAFASLAAELQRGALLPVFSEDPDCSLCIMYRSFVAQKIADYFYPEAVPDPFQIFYDIRLNWLNDRDDRVCDLYNAGSTSAAKTAILNALDDYLDGYEYNQTVKSWSRGIIADMLLNTWLNLLFQENEHISQYTDSTAINCETSCQEAGEIFDSFTDIDGKNLLSHPPDTAPPGVIWGANAGVWTIDTNQAKSNGATGSRIWIESGLPDCEISMDLTPASTSDQSAYQGIGFRRTDNNNYLTAVWKGGASALFYEIQKRVNGNLQTLEAVSASENYDQRELKVVLGHNIEFYVNDELTLSTTDDFNEMATSHGLIAGEASQARFDNFSVAEPGE